MATKANKEEYLGSPLAVPYKVFESDSKRALRQKAMVRDADNAVKNYKEVEAETVREQKKQDDATKEAYDKVSPIGKSIPPAPEKKYASGGSIRGGGCESRGKTKGRMV